MAFRADPLLSEQVQAIAQGPDGRVWLATSVGLQVYDGYEVELFTGHPDDDAAFPRGAVRTLFVDSRDRLWVGHALGLVLLDPIHDRVERLYRHDPDDPYSLALGDVTAIHEDGGGRLWVGVLNWQSPGVGGLHRLDESTGRFERYQHDPRDPSTLSHNWVRTVLQDSRGDLWVGTWHGLNRMRSDGEGFVRYLHDPSDPSSLAYDDVMDLHEDAAGTLWVATIGGGLDRYEPERDTFAHVRWGGGGYIMALAEDAAGRLWIATIDEGLAVLEPGADQPRRVALGPEAGSSGRIDALGITRDRVLWVAGLASADGGGRILRTDLEAPAFTIRNLPNAQAIAEGSEGRVWVGSGSRLVAWDPGVDGPRFFDCPGLGPPDARHWLTSIVAEPDGTLWLGYWDAELGLCRLDPDADQPVPVRSERPESVRLLWVADMAWSDGRLWLAADGNLVGLDPRTEALDVVERAPLDPLDRGRSSIWNVESDATGDLWYSTIDGRIRRRRAGTGAIDRFEGAIPGQASYDYGSVRSMRARAGGTLWLATDGFGLCEFDPSSGGCRRMFDADGGLPSDYVVDAVEDDRGRVWVGTLGAISELDPTTGSLRQLVLPPAALGARFRSGAGTLTSDGHVYFGSSVGAVVFHSDSASGNRVPPVARITRIETVGGGDVDPLSASAGSETEELELSSDQQDLVVEYVGLHYADPHTNHYAYRLDGLDETWRQVGTERRARITNLRPGSYTFRVRAASANGVWGEDTSFGFRILAPWWRRPWALALWTILAFGGLAALQIAATRRREFAATLQREQAEARRLSELAAAKSRLFANLSHEYRTPLALILGQLEAARDDLVAESDGPEKLEMAERQTRELQRLTDELLEMSRLEAGALELDWRIADIVPLLRRTLAAFDSAARAAGVELGLVAPNHPVPVRYDADRLRRVVSNLLSNALKFTPAGGRVSITVDEIEGSEQVRIAVEDTGVGISPEAQEQIFDRFYQVEVGGASAGGSGIGLAFVRELVELHGGTISVESEVGEGTRLVIVLPRARFDEPAPAVPADPEPDASDRPIVLVVDDHADMRAFLRQELGEAYEIAEAPDGSGGLERAIELVPDLVITDVVMPGMDGYEFVRRLRTDVRTSHIPIVMLTGRTSDDARITGLESGVDDYLPKPFSARILRTRVRNLLEIRRLLRARYSGDVWLKPDQVEAPSVDQEFLEKVARTIEDHMSDRDFSVEQLARAVSMSRSQLHRKLSALLGQSPGALIRAMRLQRSADLIRSGSRTLSQITFDTGFSDQAHFSRSFKKQFGCTPSEFRDRPPDASSR